MPTGSHYDCQLTECRYHYCTDNVESLLQSCIFSQTTIYSKYPKDDQRDQNKKYLVLP